MLSYKIPVSVVLLIVYSNANIYGYEIVICVPLGLTVAASTSWGILDLSTSSFGPSLGLFHVDKVCLYLLNYTVAHLKNIKSPRFQPPK